MIDENRYFKHHDTKLVAAILASGIAHFLQIDQQMSTSRQVWFVLDNPEECKVFESDYYNRKTMVDPVTFFDSYDRLLDKITQFKREGAFI